MTRDMTAREFRAAVARRGWKKELLWIVGTDHEGRTCGVGMVMTKNGRGWQVNYRASLAKAIRELQEVEQ